MTLIDVLTEDLQRLRGAEKDQVRILKQLSEAAANEELRKAFEEHLKETKEQLRRLDIILEQIGVQPNNIVPEAIEKLAADALEAIGQDADGDVIDLQLIASAQKTEHFEIACYQSAAAAAEALAMVHTAELLWETLQEEREISRKLERLAHPILKVAAEKDLEEVEAGDDNQ